jgi:hypothetical protein
MLQGIRLLLVRCGRVNDMRGKGRFWIQAAVRRKGALSKQLGIPEEKNIPVTLLERIRKAKIGTTIKNPTKTGKRTIKVTNKLKRRAVLALTLKRLRRR